MNKAEMFELSREKWGLRSQILMLVEELNELSVATLHLLRKNKPQDLALQSFAEEIADVEFMLEEMKYYFENQGLIHIFRAQKEEYLKRLLSES